MSTSTSVGAAMTARESGSSVPTALGLGTVSAAVPGPVHTPPARAWLDARLAEFRDPAGA